MEPVVSFDNWLSGLDLVITANQARREQTRSALEEARALVQRHAQTLAELDADHAKATRLKRLWIVNQHYSPVGLVPAAQAAPESAPVSVSVPIVVLDTPEPEVIEKPPPPPPTAVTTTTATTIAVKKSLSSRRKTTTTTTTAAAVTKKARTTTTKRSVDVEFIEPDPIELIDSDDYEDEASETDNDEEQEGAAAAVARAPMTRSKYAAGKAVARKKRREPPPEEDSDDSGEDIVKQRGDLRTYKQYRCIVAALMFIARGVERDAEPPALFLELEKHIDGIDAKWRLAASPEESRLVLADGAAIRSEYTTLVMHAALIESKGAPTEPDQPKHCTVCNNNHASSELEVLEFVIIAGYTHAPVCSITDIPRLTMLLEQARTIHELRCHGKTPTGAKVERMRHVVGGRCGRRIKIAHAMITANRDALVQVLERRKDFRVAGENTFLIKELGKQLHVQRKQLYSQFTELLAELRAADK